LEAQRELLPFHLDDEGWRGRFLVSTLMAVEAVSFWGVIETKWPTT